MTYESDMHYWIINAPGRPDTRVLGDRVINGLATSPEDIREMLQVALAVARQRAAYGRRERRLLVLVDAEALDNVTRPLAEALAASGREGGVILAFRRESEDA